MKHLVFILTVTAVLNLFTSNSVGQNARDKSQAVQLAVITEVLQTTNYTYLHVSTDSTMQWLAVPSMKLSVGDTCYYKGGLVMPDFTSKELTRTFDRVIFLESVSKTPEAAQKPPLGMPEHGKKPKQGKLEVNVEPATDGITIAELYQNKDNYNGKVVKIRGQVVKYSPGIMGTNWAHLQDGTSFGEKFDLAATLDGTLTVGEVVTLSSKVSVNKDFGSGYFFEVILEDAEIK